MGIKLQPQWAHRQSLIIENGTSLSLQNGEWIIRIGDLKIPPRPNQTASNVRAMLMEVSCTELANGSGNQDFDVAQKDVDTDAVAKGDETLIRGFLDSVTEGSGVPSIANPETSRSLIRRTKVHEKDKDTTPASTAADFELAILFLDILRGPRG